MDTNSKPAKKTQYSATMPDGRVVTRTSHRTYTHAVAGLYNNEDGTSTWHVCGFCGSKALADKQAAMRRSATRAQVVRVVEVWT